MAWISSSSRTGASTCCAGWSSAAAPRPRSAPRRSSSSPISAPGPGASWAGTSCTERCGATGRGWALAWEGAGPRWPRTVAALDVALAAGGPRELALRLARCRIRVQNGDIAGAEADGRRASALAASPAAAAEVALIEVSVAVQRGDPSGALALLERVDRGALSPLRALQWLATRATVLLDLGRAREAREAALEQIARAEADGVTGLVEQARVNAALADLSLGQPARAVAELERALGYYRGRDGYVEGTVLGLLGTAWLALGDPVVARGWLEAARDAHARHGLVDRVALVDANLALVLRASGQHAAAMTLTRRALAAHRASGFVRGERRALLNLALDAIACDDGPAAAQALEEAASLATDPVGRLRLFCLHAIRHARAGSVADAEVAWAAARDPSAEGESAALLEVALAWVDAARAHRDGQPASVRPPDPMPPHAVVRFGWTLLRAWVTGRETASFVQDP